MSRPCGTYLFDCQSVYAAGTREHNTWRWYLEQVAGEAKNDIRAYAVRVESRTGGAFGRMQELDFPAHVKDVIKYSQPFTSKEVFYTDGTTEITTDAAFSERRKYREYPKPFWKAIPIFLDNGVQIHLTDQREHRERYGKTVTPEAHIEKLRLTTLRHIGYPDDDMWPVHDTDPLARARIAQIYRLTPCGAAPVTWKMIREDRQQHKDFLYGVRMEDLPRYEAWDRRRLTAGVNKYRRETSLEARQWNNQHTR